MCHYSDETASNLKAQQRKKKVHCTKYLESKYATRFSTNLIMHAANKTKETFSAAREQILKVLSFWLTYCYYSKFLEENQKVTLWSKALCENIKQLHDG